MPYPYLEIEGIHAGQLPQTPDTFQTIIKDYDLIIEIGTNQGGFTIWLNNNKKETAKLISLEINPETIKIPKDHPAHQTIRIQNALHPDTITQIQQEINQREKTLILCDGGNKNQEFDTYAQIIKPGDTIMLHDYADSPNEEENYRKAKQKQVGDAWPNGPETNLATITQTINQQNLEKYQYPKFTAILWGSFQKRG